MDAREVEEPFADPETELHLKREWAQEVVCKAHSVINKAMIICNYYSDDLPVCPDDPSQSELPFTLCLDDFRFNNILVGTILNGRCTFFPC